MENKITPEKGYCMYCDTEIDVTFCCSGHECGCMGLPVDPPICDKEECYNKFQNRFKVK